MQSSVASGRSQHRQPGLREHCHVLRTRLPHNKHDVNDTVATKFQDQLSPVQGVARLKSTITTVL